LQRVANSVFKSLSINHLKNNSMKKILIFVAFIAFFTPSVSFAQVPFTVGTADSVTTAVDAVLVPNAALRATALKPLFEKLNNRTKSVEQSANGRMSNIEGVSALKANKTDLDTAKAALRTESSNNYNYVLQNFADTARLPYRMLSWFGTQTDTTTLNRAVNYCASKNVRLIVDEGVWLCNSASVNLTDFDLQIEAVNREKSILRLNKTPNNLRLLTATASGTMGARCTCKNVTFDFQGQGEQNKGIVLDAKLVEFDNCVFTNCGQTALNLGGPLFGDSAKFIVKNCIFKKPTSPNFGNFIYVTSGTLICDFSEFLGENFSDLQKNQGGIIASGYLPTKRFPSLIVKNCKFSKLGTGTTAGNYQSAVYCYDFCKKLVVENCEFDSLTFGAIAANHTTEIRIKDNKIKRCQYSPNLIWKSALIATSQSANPKISEKTSLEISGNSVENYAGFNTTTSSSIFISAISSDSFLSNSIIANNTTDTSKFHYGIYTLGTFNGNFSGNKILNANNGLYNDNAKGDVNVTNNYLNGIGVPLTFANSAANINVTNNTLNSPNVSAWFEGSTNVSLVNNRYVGGQVYNVGGAGASLFSIENKLLSFHPSAASVVKKSVTAN
jgi:hypothetical protein